MAGGSECERRESARARAREAAAAEKSRRARSSLVVCRSCAVVVCCGGCARPSRLRADWLLQHSANRLVFDEMRRATGGAQRAARGDRRAVASEWQRRASLPSLARRRSPPSHTRKKSNWKRQRASERTLHFRAQRRCEAPVACARIRRSHRRRRRSRRHRRHCRHRRRRRRHCVRVFAPRALDSLVGRANEARERRGLNDAERIARLHTLENL